MELKYKDLPNMFYSLVKPDPVKGAELVILNTALADDLGLGSLELKDKKYLDIFAGNKTLEGEYFIAQAYAGHQFGHFTILGDGRAKLIKEHVTRSGERYDIQLKGSGRTPYSRGGDGRASLGPMIREYLISEAMHSLNIPTTRALALVTTGEPVFRQTPLEGAILTRVAKSHIRVGTFEYAVRAKLEDLKALADYTIWRHFDYIKDDVNPYLSMLEEAIKSQASLIAKWQHVGFVHGVMNTDNMTICGETIDYGPCAFMDEYKEDTVFSSIDRGGRYAYNNQPKIGAWNLARFAESLVPLIHKDQDEALELANKAISTYHDLYEQNYLDGMRLKLGITNKEKEDKELIDELLGLMSKYKADYTNTFVSLTLGELENNNLFMSKDFNDWKNKWNLKDGICKETMKKHNPVIIPRNHQVEKAIRAAKEENFKVFEDFLSVLSNPYNYKDIPREYMKPAQNSDDKYVTFCGT